jgi:hypothetical protein
MVGEILQVLAGKVGKREKVAVTPSLPISPQPLLPNQATPSQTPVSSSPITSPSELLRCKSKSQGTKTVALKGFVEASASEILTASKGCETDSNAVVLSSRKGTENWLPAASTFKALFTRNFSDKFTITVNVASPRSFATTVGETSLMGSGMA